MNRILHCLIVALVLCFLIQGMVFAQQATIAPIPQGVPRAAGVALGTFPDYEGSDDYEVGALPVAQYSWGNRNILLTGNVLAANLLDHDTFLLGPVVAYRPGRDDVDDNAVDKMKDIDDAIELGAFVGAKFSNPERPRIRSRVSLEFLQDVTDEHDGYTVQLWGVGWYPVYPEIDVGARGGLTYADGDYMSTFFGVNPADSLASGLSTFDADSGMKDIYIQPMVAWHISKSWHALVALRYKRLLSDAEDSPVVDDRGSADQFLAAIGIVYSW